MAITAQQVNLQKSRIESIMSGLCITDEIPNKHLSTCIDVSQEVIMAMSLIIEDIDDDHKNDIKIIAQVYNFDSADLIGRKQELLEDAKKSLDNIKALYLVAGDTKVLPSHAPFFASHIITAIMNLERLVFWLSKV